MQLIVFVTLTMMDHLSLDCAVRDDISRQDISAADARAKHMLCNVSGACVVVICRGPPSPRNPNVETRFREGGSYALDEPETDLRFNHTNR